MFPTEFLLLIRVFFLLFNYLFTLRYISLFLFVDFSFSSLYPSSPLFPFDYTLSLDLRSFRGLSLSLYSLFCTRMIPPFAVAFCVFFLWLHALEQIRFVCFVENRSLLFC